MDDEDFREMMESFGVTPIRKEDKRRPPRREKPPAKERVPPAAQAKATRAKAPDPDDDDRLFLAVMGQTESIPDKDGRSSPRRPPGLRRLKTPKTAKDAEPEATLDLHGLTVEKALESLERFVVTAAAGRLGTVLVVTGKGLRSESGRSVVKEAAERWLFTRGKRWVKAYSEAPRALGGRGAYLFHLR